MLWIDSVPSVRYQTAKMIARMHAHSAVVPPYGMPTIRCMASATPVPKIAIARARNQYAVAT